MSTYFLKETYMGENMTSSINQKMEYETCVLTPHHRTTGLQDETGSMNKYH